ncbi:MAG: cobalamin-binding protein, partial [Venatoribacter sp.]
MKKLLFAALCWLAQPALALTLVDDLGQSFSLEQPASRIIALTPHTTELLFSLGVGERIIATVEYADFPEQAKKIPLVGGYEGFNIEAIFSYQPDVVLYWPDGNPMREIERLKQLKLPLFAVNTNSFERVASDLIKLGQLTNTEAKAQQLADEFLAEIAKIRQENQAKTKLKVFYQVWHQPMLSQNKDSFISQIIELCGGENIFADLPVLSPQISVESVLAANPDVILASGNNNQRPAWLDEWSRYSMLNAVKNQHIYNTTPDWLHRP